MGVTLLGVITASGEMAALEVCGAIVEAVAYAHLRLVSIRVVRFGQCVCSEESDGI